MGIEYKITLSSDDFAAFEQDVRGMTLDRVLREAPGFVTSDGTAYSYNTADHPDNEWLETISIQDDGLWLALYSCEPLLSYMMNAVLDICGRLRIEDG
jgi:hypothetical protein